MLKRALTASLLAVLSTAFAHAGYSPADTTDITKKDTVGLLTVRTAPADPKEGFKDLFIGNTESNGIRVEQLNPLAIGFVEDYMEKFSDDMEDMKDWGKPYFDMMDLILVSHSLPKELKYLAVVESRLKSQARSWAGAVGPWQFMASTARTMGLKVNKYVDERRDLTKSTHAACKYLNSLYSIYGDWLLVIAAYNGGPGKVNSAIRRSGSRDFWTLQKYLPLESRNHVKKFIATHYIMEGEGGITTLTKKEAGLLLTANSTGVAIDTSSTAKLQAISGRYHSSVLTRHIAMDIAAFNKINPDFDRLISYNGKYDLRLPADKMELFVAKKSDILAESLQFLLNPDYSVQTSSTNR